MRKYPRPVETFCMPYRVHSGRGQLWGEICGKRACGPFNNNASKGIMNLQKIGWATLIATFNSFGTIMLKHWTFQCRGTSKRCCKNTSIASPQNRNIVLIPRPQNNTAQRHKNLTLSTFHPCCHQMNSRKYNESLAAS